VQHSIRYDPSFSLLDVSLEPGEKIVAEAGAMAWMEGPIDVKTSTRGGVLRGLKWRILSGESFFQNTYVATGPGARIALAPGSAGDVVAHNLVDEELYMQRGAYLASETGVDCDARFDGLRGFFNEGLFILRCLGTGTLFFTAYGDVQPVDVDGEYVVDNGYAVAWEPSLQWRLTRARRIRSFLFGDQLLLRFSGRGRVWIQSRSPQSLANFAHPFRRVQRRQS
jgi:uncharacterized protein (TIGR00266 family)